MKILLLASLFVSLSANATQYCYDYGLMAVYDIEKSLLSCEGKVMGSKLSIRPLKVLEKRITSNYPLFYKQRAIKGLYNVSLYLNNLEKNECYNQVLIDFNKIYKARIFKSINSCSLF